MNKLWIDFDSLPEKREALRKRGIYTYRGASISNTMVFRMIAKIAHSYAVAEIGIDRFEPLLTDYIRGKPGDIEYLIGGTEQPEPETTAPYSLSCWTEECRGIPHLVTSVRFLADKKARTYIAVVGPLK
ncbi:MAG: hypothetical protein EXQ88_00520 [Alphaproteobacteria bacterium]|nr:hypothetical protein [Alphaproteobacteria bacterium]